MKIAPVKCIIVDDEPIARQILLGYVAKMPNLLCAGTCKNALEALTLLRADDSIQIVFLDINMPHLNGMAMAKLLPPHVRFVLTTAYSEYAVASYELNAVDYLLKPFLFDRFAQAVFKVMDALKPTVVPQSANELIVKSDGEIHRVPVAELMYCEAMKNYTKLVLAKGNVYYPLMSISKFEAHLLSVSTDFLRIHRSFLISKLHIGAVGANYLMIATHRIPIGQQYKNAVWSALGL
jgi:DNA-binding LytR/AlgR family response regulator